MFYGPDELPPEDDMGARSTSPNSFPFADYGMKEEIKVDTPSRIMIEKGYLHIPFELLEDMDLKKLPYVAVFSNRKERTIGVKSVSHRYKKRKSTTDYDLEEYYSINISGLVQNLGLSITKKYSTEILDIGTKFVVFKVKDRIQPVVMKDVPPEKEVQKRVVDDDDDLKPRGSGITVGQEMVLPGSDF